MKNLYLTAILPPDELMQQIDDIRKECAAKYNVQAALKPPVHITLFRPFKLEAERENGLLKMLQSVMRNHGPFCVELENFDTFNSSVVYIRVLRSQMLWDLERDIVKSYKLHKIDTPEVKSNKAFHPHITIAYRDIPSSTFPIMWKEYKSAKFKRTFFADHFTLLKHDGKKWQPFRDFELQKPAELSLF